MGLFADSIIASSTRVLSQVDTKVESIAVELYTEVVNNSPTKPSANTAKGEFINNWMAAAGRIDSSTRAAKNYSGMASRNSITSLRGGRTFYRKDGKVTLTNNTPYGFRVEYAGWPKPNWSGNVGPYAPIAKAFILVAPKYRP